MFENVKNLLKTARELDENDGWIMSVDNEVKEVIIEMNTIDQLFDRGIDALNNSLQDYTPTTIMIKQRKGQKHSVTTLHDDGDLYASFRVTVTSDEIIIHANTIKDGDDLTDKYGDEIIGLTADNRDELGRLILNNLHLYVRKKLQIL